MPSFVILLTGTINPGNVPFLKMVSPEMREAEYCKAIKKWLALGYPVVFCENSDYNSSVIDNLCNTAAAGQFEYLKFASQHSHKGKGNGEAEILDHIFENSALVKNASWLCKATGKNFVKNAKAIIRQTEKNKSNSTLVTSNITLNLSFADSRLFFFAPRFYFDYLQPNLQMINEADGFYFEHALAKSIHAAFKEDNPWLMIPAVPVYEGYYGTLGTKYKSNVVKQFAKTMAHNLKKKLFALAY